MAESSKRDAKTNDAPVSPDSILLAQRITLVFFGSAGLVLFLTFFDAAKIVLLGLLAAACLACALRPLVRRTPGPRSLKAVLIGLMPPLVIVALLILTVLLVAEPVQRTFGEWPKMEQQINRVLSDWSRHFGLEPPLQIRGILGEVGNWITGGTGAKLFTTTTGILSGVAVALAFVFMGSIFLLAEPPSRLIKPVLKFFSERRQSQLELAFADLAPRLRAWLIGTIFGATVIAVTSYIGYSLVGLEFALPLALFAGVGEMVPTIGPIVTFVVALVFAVGQGVGKMVGVFMVYLVVQGLESYVLMPLVMKKAVNIPPVVTLFTLVFWGTLFGLPGLLLAIPIDLVIWSFAEHLLTRRENTEQA